MPEFLGDAILELQTNAAPLRRGMLAAESEVRASLTRMEGETSRRFAAMGGRMSSVGRTMTRTVTLPILGLAGAAAKMAMDFDRSMEMIHTQAGASQREVDKMRQSVLALSHVLPDSPNVLAQGLFHLESIGLRGSKALDALKIAAQGAAVGNTNLEETTTALGSAWLVNMKGAGDLKNVMAILNATVGAGNVRMGDLVQALGTGVLPAAKLAGLSIKDVMGALAVFTDEGYNASSAAAQFGTALHFLYDPSSKADTALKSIGMTSTQMAQDMHKPNGLLVALTDLHSHLQSLSQVDQERILGAIFPGGRGRVMLTLLNQLDRYNMKLGQITKGQNNFAEDVHRTMEQPAVRIQQAWAGMSSELVRFGSDVLPPLLNAGTKVVDFADKAVASFTKLPAGLQHSIITGGLVLAGIGPAMRLLGLFTTGVGRLTSLAARIGGIAGIGPLATGVAGAEKVSQMVATMEVGTLIAKSMVGGGMPGGVGGFEKTAAAAAAADAAAAERAAALRMARLSSGVGGAAVAGVLGFASMSHATDSPLNKLNAFAHGIDPTNVLHLIGLPSVSDLLPGVQKKMDPTVAMRASILGPLLQPTRRAIGGTPTTPVYGLTPRPITQGAGTGIQRQGDPAFDPRAIEQATKDYERMNLELSKLESRKQGVNATARALDNLATQAQKSNDIRWMLADKLGAELLRTRNVESRGVQTMIRDMDKLAPGARSAASQAMTQMTRELETMGRLPRGSTVRLISDMLRDYSGMKDKGGHYFHELMINATGELQFLERMAKNSSGEMRQQYLGEIDTLRHGVGVGFQNMLNDVVDKQAKQRRAIQRGTAGATTDAMNNLQRYEDNVQNAMKNGVLSSDKGAQLLTIAVNSTLKAFGAKPIPFPKAAGVSGMSAPGAPLRPGFNAAQGALIQIGRPGERGGDYIPLNVGGMNIRAGSGEKVAVFTADQQRIMDMALADYGGLEGMFGAARRRHDQTPRYATGGYVYPLPPGTSVGRTDMGIDANMPVGAPIGPVGRSRIMGINPNWYQGQPYMWWQLLDGPDAGRMIYLAEEISPAARPGQTVAANQAIAHYAPSGTGIEMGWASGGGRTLAQATSGYSEGQQTPAGLAYRAFLAGLSHGRLVDVGGGIAEVAAPMVRGTGTIADMVRASLKKSTAAANHYIQSHLPMSIGGGTFTGFGALNGNVEQQVYQFFSRAGLNKVAIAGLLGNAVQESNMNPTTPGGGLWQMISTFGQGAPPLVQQMQSLYSQIHGSNIWAMLNAASSPADAATIFMSMFERPAVATENLPRRIAGANAAYAAGYTTGGVARGPKRRQGISQSRHGATSNELKELTAAGRKVAYLEGDLTNYLNQYTALSGRFSTDESQSQYLNPDGSLNPAGIAKKIKDDQILLGLAQHIMRDYQMEVGPVSSQLSKFLSKSARTEKHIATDERKLKSNKIREASIRAAITALSKPGPNRVGALETVIRSTRAHYDPAIKAAERALASYHGSNRTHRNQLRDAVTHARGTEAYALGPLYSALAQARGQQSTHASHVKGKRFTFQQELRALEVQDAKLKANAATLKAILTGAGGNQGTNATITALEEVAGKLGMVEWDRHGKFKGINMKNQGAAFDEQTTIDQLRIQLGQDLGLTAAAVGPSQQQQIDLLSQLVQQQGLELAVSRAQYQVLSSLPPFGGSFAAGGVVPGPPGAPRTVIAHGGEPIGAQSSTIKIVLEDNRARIYKDGVEQAIERVGRRQVRTVGRRLAGAGGGMR